MKTFFKKTVLACSVAAASLFAASAAHAVALNDFTVRHVEGGVTTEFVADKIIGNYVEVATFNNDGTFNVSLFFSASSFVKNDGVDNIMAGTSRLGVDYGIYALYTASGNVSSSGGKTTFTFQPGSGSLNMFLDENANTERLVNPVNGSGAFTLSNTGDDKRIGTGNPLAGQGTLDPSLSTCGSGGGSGINCGSFGSTTSFALTLPDGINFFILPNPFYDLSFQSGQLNNFDPTGTQVINGSADVVFGRVPEPSSTALLGLGLMALGFTARRRKNKQS